MVTTSNAPSRPARLSSAVPALAPTKPLVNLVHANAIALNFTIDAKVLEPNIPSGLTLDHYKGDTFVSLVCMEIRRLPFLGLPIVPRFCELSLRCFVSQRNDHRRQGVLYLKSYASRKLGAWVLGNLLPHPYQQLGIKANNVGYGDQSVPEIDLREHRLRSENSWPGRKESGSR